MRIGEVLKIRPVDVKNLVKKNKPHPLLNNELRSVLEIENPCPNYKQR
jgi:hypothetical protein